MNGASGSDTEHEEEEPMQIEMSTQQLLLDARVQQELQEGSMVGRKVARKFPGPAYNGGGIHHGMVIAVVGGEGDRMDPDDLPAAELRALHGGGEEMYRVRYDDGDLHAYTESELGPMIEEGMKPQSKKQKRKGTQVGAARGAVGQGGSKMRERHYSHEVEAAPSAHAQ